MTATPTPGPRIALTDPCNPSFHWVPQLAQDSLGSCALDIRLEGDAVERVADVVAGVRTSAVRPLELRYHFPLSGYDFSANDPEEARRGFLGAISAIDGLAEAGGRFLTVHLPIGWDELACRLPVARHNLTELTAYAAQREVTVCLENLRWGVTSDPDVFMGLVDAAGCAVTLDVGHANSSDVAKRGFSSVDYAKLVAPHVRNAHVYDREEPHHHCPENLDRIGETLEALLGSECDWWVIELFDREEVEFTRELLQGFLREQGRPTPLCAADDEGAR